MLAVWLVGCGRLAFDPAADAAGAPGADAFACPPGTFCELCAVSIITVIHDGDNNDDAGGDAMATAVAQACSTSVTIVNVSQNDPGVLDPTTKRPLLPAGSLGVMCGGPAVQLGLQYLDLQGETPVVFEYTTSDVLLRQRSTGNAVLDIPQSALSQSHDLGIVHVSHESTTGAMFLSVAGLAAQGTITTAALFVSQLAGGAATDTLAWYAIDWLDQDADTWPSGPDTVSILASGR